MNYIQLGDVIATAKVNRCGENDFPVLSITKSDGIVLQSEKFKKRIASKNTADYKVVHRGQLVQGIHIDEANFGIQEVVDIGIVSPAYKIWNIKSNIIVPKYLEIVLRSPRSIAYYTSKFNGSIKRRERLSDKDFLQMRIPCPAVEEQIYAIEVLNKAAELIGQRRQQLIELDNLIKARFVEMFGDPKYNEREWKTLPLYKVLETGSSVSYGIVQTGDDVEGGVPVFRPVDIVGGRTPYCEQLKRTTNEISNQYKRTILKGYELLITVRGSIGETFRVTDEFKGCNVGRNIVPLRFNTALVNYPFMQQFFAQDGTKQILASMTKGIALQGLNMSEFREISVIIPDASLQNQYAFFVEQVDKSKVVVQKALNEAQTLFDSLMQEYFG